MSLRELFPEVKFDKTPLEQLGKVLDELVEAEEALGETDRDHAVEEVIDVLHSAANVLYKMKCTDTEISDAILYVQAKNYMRGKYAL